MFDEDYEIEVAIEGIDSKGKVVGSVGSGRTVNPATQSTDTSGSSNIGRPTYGG